MTGNIVINQNRGEYNEYNRKFSTTFAEFYITKRLVCEIFNIETVGSRLVNMLTERMGFDRILGFSQISIRIRIPFGNLIMKSYFLYVCDTHEI